MRDWEERFAAIFAAQLRAKRKGKVGKTWFVDETYIRVRGRWCYLYRATDEDGNLVDVRLSVPTRCAMSVKKEATNEL